MHYHLADDAASQLSPLRCLCLPDGTTCADERRSTFYLNTVAPISLFCATGLQPFRWRGDGGEQRGALPTGSPRRERGFYLPAVSA